MKNKTPKNETALVIIDVQQKFCDPKGARGTRKTDEIATRISKLVNAFRKASIPVYAVYFCKDKKDIDYYKFRPARGEKIITKTTNSAFASSPIETILSKAKHQNLLICGFNQTACVAQTAIDARSYGYNVILLRDLSGDDNSEGLKQDKGTSLYVMKDRGVVFSTSAKVLKKLAK